MMFIILSDHLSKILYNNKIIIVICLNKKVLIFPVKSHIRSKWWGRICYEKDF